MSEDIGVALKETRRQLAALRDVAQALGTNLELATLLPAIIEQVCALVACDRASLFLIDEKTGELWSEVQIGHDAEIRLPRGTGIAGAVVEARCPVRLDDAWADARFHRAIDDATGYRTRTLLAVPIVDKDGVVRGVVEALNRKDNVPFKDDDERLLMALGSEIAVALQRATLFDELARKKAALDRRVKELDLLVDIDRALLRADGVQAVLEVVVARITDVLAADAASVALIDGRTSALVFRAAAGPGQDKLRMRSMPSDTGLAGVVLADGVAVRVDDAATDPRHATKMSQATSLLPGPLLAVPLLPATERLEKTHQAVKPLGVLTVLRGRREGVVSFTDDDERILSLLAARVSQALVDEESKEKSRAQAQMQTIGHMLSGIVHDFKTPMTVISGYVQLLADENDPKERASNSEIILKSCDQMTLMIKELLSFAKGESTVFLRKVWLETFVHDLEPMLQRMVEKTGIKLVVEAKTKSSGRLDDLKLKRAIVNLVKNAKEALVDAAPANNGAGGVITVGIREEGDDIVFVVKDNGPGLAPEIEARLFESFATFGKAEGTGLGLALVKKIAEEHHGGVVVDSEEGVGCTFTIRIPRA